MAMNTVLSMKMSLLHEFHQDAYALAWLLGVAACVAVICTVAVLFTRMIRHWLVLMRQETQRQIAADEFLGRVLRQSRPEDWVSGGGEVAGGCAGPPVSR
jgi:hypothetical protein